MVEPGDAAEIQAELAAWEQLWDALEAEGVDALAPVVRAASARYAGDTCGMRYRRLYRGVDAQAHEHLVIAAFANDPQAKRQLLQPLLDSPDAQIRSRAAVELARTALRQGNPEAAESALRRSEGLDLPAACEADRRYLEGRIAVQRGDGVAALSAFTAANALDPGYWDAYRERLPLLVDALHDPGQGTAACLRHARSLIEVLGLLPHLADDTRQFAKLALSLERFEAHNSATLLASGITWRWAGQEVHALGVLSRAQRAHAMLPDACEREIRARIATMLEGS
ncbi:MAG: hypothetical protein OXC69_08615 [Candidatus Tectomicrobia bacterium]|nr:hypothetical protein [Candidatus Tectomicrobia bacterium]